MGADVQNHSMRGAAGWPGRSVSEPTSSPSRKPWANACCCQPCASRTADTVIVADGFSCQEQISQLTGRRAIHLAEALRMALRT